MALEAKNVKRDRLIRIGIVPVLLGAAVAAVLRLALGLVWQAGLVSEDILNPRIMERALQDRIYYDRVVAEVGRIHNAGLTAVTLVAWGAAAVWFARCWRTRVARVGSVQRQAAVWTWIGVGGLLVSYGAAGYIAWDTSLSSLVNYNAVLTNGLLVGFFHCLTYWATSVLCTQATYVSAIPGSGWRT